MKTKYIDAEKLIAEIKRYSMTEYNGGTICEDVANCALDYVTLEIIPSLQQEAEEECKKRNDEIQKTSIEYRDSVIKHIETKRVLPEFRGQLLHDFKNELNTMKQILNIQMWPQTQYAIFEKVALVFAAWGGYHFHPKNPPTEASLQQEQPTNTDNLCSELTDFLVRNDVPEEKAKFLANRILDVYGSKKYLEGLCDGIKQEQPEVDLEKYIENELKHYGLSLYEASYGTFSASQIDRIIRNAFKLGLNARK